MHPVLHRFSVSDTIQIKSAAGCKAANKKYLLEQIPLKKQSDS